MLQHIPGSIASECCIVCECNVAEIHKGVDGKFFGNKGAVVCGRCRNLFLPGEGAQELSPCFVSQIATSEHWEEGGAGLNCRALGTQADFCLLPKMQRSCRVAFPIWKVRVFSLQLGKSTAQGDEGM